MSDMIIQVNEKNEVIGLTPREDFYGGRIIHRGVHLILFNSKGETAIMKRSANKRWYPNLYTFSVSGTVDNETNAECIEREIKEEIGLDIKPKELFTFRHKDEYDDAFATLYSAISDIELIPDKQEISKVDWVTLAWLKEDIINNPTKYTHTMLEGMKVYFDKYDIKLP
jgi:isopentenyl-diphosphate Delta-isomerase